MPRVWNKAWEQDIPEDAVYVGRPTKWGNPYSHKEGTLAAYRVSTREEAVGCYEEWIEGDPTLWAAAVNELRGKDLVCWCAPAPCHADILLRLANK